MSEGKGGFLLLIVEQAVPTDASRPDSLDGAGTVPEAKSMASARASTAADVRECFAYGREVGAEVEMETVAGGEGFGCA